MKKILFSIVLWAAVAAGCTSSFEEVNTDPDNPNAELVPSTNTLAFCERYASDSPARLPSGCTLRKVIMTSVPT